MADETTTRRSFLAAIPLAATFGLLVSPLMRYLRPTIKPMDILGPSDQPKALKDVAFTQKDFPEEWTCLPFMFSQSYKEYNPELMEVRQIPGFAVKLPTGEVVAYSRICPHLGCIFNFVKDPEECLKGYNFKPNGPVFACPCHLSVYDIAQGGKVVSGPAPRPPRQFTVKSDGDKISILSLEAGGIA
ncbi:MAG: ubiquinol-cytochrome c reductase iron-sulfur subunit [Candidatus Obscuribacterales bacterium]|jgi:Rieske Fe-S protein|nr:ubiquinol-cytochrome c reductase iron-sulfur subunit [Candidatus Obscuribacterales bacterium]